MCRSTFDPLHNLCQRNDELPCRISQRSQNHMNVSRHDDGHMQFVTDPVIVAAAPKHDLTRQIRQGPPMFRYKSDEVWFGVTLQMRQIAPVEGHKPILGLASKDAARIFLHWFHFGTRSGRCPPLPGRAKLGCSRLKLDVRDDKRSGELRSPGQTWASGPTLFGMCIWSRRAGLRNTTLRVPSVRAWRGHPYP